MAAWLRGTGASRMRASKRRVFQSFPRASLALSIPSEELFLIVCVYLILIIYSIMNIILMAWARFACVAYCLLGCLLAQMGSLYAGEGKAVAHRCCDERFANAWTSGTAPSGGDSELGQQVLLQRKDDYASPFYIYATAGLG